MKAFSIFLASVSIVAFLSCSAEEDRPPIENSNLLGEWWLDGIDYQGTSKVNYNGTNVTSSFTGEGYDFDASVFFSQDPKTWESSGSYKVRLTQLYLGQSEIMEVPIDNFEGSGEYSIDGNKLLLLNQKINLPTGGLSNGTGINESTILELSSNKMVLTFNETMTITESGMEVEVTINGQQVFIK